MQVMFFFFEGMPSQTLQGPGSPESSCGQFERHFRLEDYVHEKVLQLVDESTRHLDLPRLLVA